MWLNCATLRIRVPLSYVTYSLINSSTVSIAHFGVIMRGAQGDNRQRATTINSIHAQWTDLRSCRIIAWIEKRYVCAGQTWAKP